MSLRYCEWLVIGSKTIRLALRVIFAQLEFDTIHQSIPARFDDVLVDANGPPGRAVLVLTFDDDPHCGRGTGVAIDDPDLVIDQLDAPQVRELTIKRFSQRGVQGV